jgi:putative salt-induced outer membrane protein
MKHSRPLLAFALLLPVAGHVAPAAAQWTGRGEAGVVVSSGNTETKAGNAKLAVAFKADEWRHEGTFAGVYAADAVETTAQRWEAALQSNYRYDQRNFVYGGLRYEDDNFSGFEHQGTLSAGVGHEFRDTPEMRFTAQLGVGYKFSESRDVLTPAGVLLAPGDSESSAALIGSADFRRALNASTTLLDKMTVEYTADNTFLQNELALQVKMNARLALALGFAVRHNTDPPAGFEKTDTQTTVNVVYEVK